jgi:hypothetical protein
MKAQCDVTTSYSFPDRQLWEGQMASINPFNFSEWLRQETSTTGGMGTGDDVELGRSNMADAHEGTQIIGFNPNNVVLAGLCETKASR